ncbi:hypothetical protein GIB67_005505 [Kingdonia uniflora]|uniref:Beta-galactosidase galactose-binding domain-containing protein n=1 Tax=Kingdonia uniflora TaxID=39325 RepID=A0A7J7NHU0_9MAGN|nr:hypothetical protein GIB67_005505 [Kingdonia uniflora]
MQMLPSNSKSLSWETYDEDIYSLGNSTLITSNGLFEHLNVTRAMSNYLWYITSVEVSPSESFLNGGEWPTLSVESKGHAMHITRSVKEYAGRTTLAIGDGENNVDMIQKADIGVEISGMEGIQDRPMAQGKTDRIALLNIVMGLPAYINAPDRDDPLALDMGSMGKSQVWINGQNIGQYWTAYAYDNCEQCSYSRTFRPPKYQVGYGQPTQKWYWLFLK